MMRRIKKNLTFAVLLMVVCTLLSSLAQVLIKIGSARVTSLATLVFNPPVIGGFALLGLGMLTLLLGMRWYELTLIYPLMSINFFWTLLFSALILGESVGSYEVAGLSCIVGGIVVLTSGGGR
jgi:drug/metabolite transporter (DMT)-like permease